MHPGNFFFYHLCTIFFRFIEYMGPFFTNGAFFPRPRCSMGNVAKLPFSALEPLRWEGLCSHWGCLCFGLWALSLHFLCEETRGS